MSWLRAAVAQRLETLPPFWTAFALTLTETVGAGILALPIVVAEVGPLAGVVVLAVLRRESLDATVASALLIGAASISLIVILSLIALSHANEANLRHSTVPLIGGEPFTPAILELIFGAVLLAYFVKGLPRRQQVGAGRGGQLEWHGVKRPARLPAHAVGQATDCDPRPSSSGWLVRPLTRAGLVTRWRSSWPPRLSPTC